MMGALDFQSKYQGRDFILCSRIEDPGGNGQAGSENGLGRFLLPMKARVKVAYVVSSTTFTAPTGWIVEAAEGGGQFTEEITAPATTVVGEPLILPFEERDPNTVFPRGTVLELQSDGGVVTAGQTAAYLHCEPVGSNDFPNNTVIFSGYVLNPAQAGGTQVGIPVPFNGELIEMGVGIGLNFNNTLDYTLRNTGTSGPGTVVESDAITAVASQGTSQITDLRASDNRFVGPDNYLNLVFAEEVLHPAFAQPWYIAVRKL